MRHFQRRNVYRGRAVTLARPSWPARNTTLTRSSRSRRSQGRLQKLNRRPALAFQSLEPRIAFAGLQAAPVPFAPQGMTVVGNVTYFSATTATQGTELWKTDGTAAGTVLVKDINAGTTSSEPRDFTAVGSTVFFTADDGVNGRELWKTDGTAAGTVLLKDIKSGTELGYDPQTDAEIQVPATSEPGNLAILNNQLFFTATANSSRQLWKSDGTATGTVLVKDTFSNNLIPYAGKLFFSGGQSLWSTDGTAAGTTVVKTDVGFYGGAASAVIGGKLIFSGYDRVNGGELFVTDGTAAGTKLLKDIATGSSTVGDFTSLNSSNPTNFTVVGSTVFFTAQDSVNGRELWKTDGTVAGTVLVKDIAQGTYQDLQWTGDDYSPVTVPRGSEPSQLTAFGTTLVFTADDGVNGTELWKSDGTAAGTTLVKDMLPGKNTESVPLSSTPSSLTPYKGAVYFLANRDELWKTDGTTVGTTRVKDFDPLYGVDPESVNAMVVVNNALVFAVDGVNGSDLWVSDGTTAGTRFLRTPLVAAVNKAPVGASKTVTILADGTYTFTGADFGFRDPDNTPANTLLAVKIATLPTAGTLTNNGVALAAGAAVSADDIVAGRLKYTMASNPAGATRASFTFRVQDNGGTTNGGVDTDPTARTFTVAPVPFAPQDMTVVGNMTYFSATTAAQGTELWKTDGTAAGTVLVKDIIAGTEGSSPSGLTAVGSTVFFTADDGVNGSELWKTDGTAAGTVLVKDINPGRSLGGSRGPASSDPRNFVMLNNQLFFTATASDSGGSELWKSDGTAAGTVSVKDMNGGGLVIHAGKVFFGRYDSQSYSSSLWSSDGTAAGTTVVKTGVSTDFFTYIGATSALIGGKLIFAGDDGVNGLELWVTDGTTAGTKLLKDIATGSSTDWDDFTWPNSSYPGQFAAVGSTVFFVANDRQNGAELWKTDGTAAGTVLVKDIAQGTGQGYPRSSLPLQLTTFGNTLVFTADDGVNGRELWKSDGTAAGTVLVKDMLPGKTAADVPLSSSPSDLTPYNGAVYFLANRDELWKTDGTTGGTTRVKDVDPDHGGDSGSGSYASMAVFNGKLLFADDDGVHGSDLWVSDGTSLGTQRLRTLVAAPVNKAPVGASKTVTVLEDGTYTFTAADFGFSDPSNTPANTLLAVKIATLPAAGRLTNNGVAVTAGAAISAADITAGRLKFAPAANASGATYASFTFRVQDNGGTANGGVDTDATARTMTVSVTPVNDAPTGTAKTVTMLEDGTYTFVAADFGFRDANDTPANTLLAVKIATLPAAGRLTNNGVAVTAGAAVTAADITAGRLKFAPAANASGATYASFTFRVQDNGGTANGGVDTDATARTMTLAVTPVNDAPTGTAKTVTMLEDGTYTFVAADFGFRDANDTPANTLLAVRIATLPAAGRLTNNGVAVTAGAAVTAADITAGRLKFAPAANASGATYASFTFRVQDNGGAANGGVDTDATARTMTLAVTPVNDAPTGTAKTVTMRRNTAYTFKVADFGFSDASDTPAHTLLAVKIVTLPAAGRLTRNGVAVTAGTAVSASDITSGLLRFAPAANGRGNTYARFTFQVRDSGGTANGGIDTDLVAKTITIAVS
jgi:ELWxxDGT repeat protein